MIESKRIPGLNPVAKLLLLISFSVLVLLMGDVVYILLVVAAILALKHVLRARSVLSKTVFGFSIAIFLTQILFNHSGDELARLGPLVVNVGGITAGILIAAKFLSLISMSWIFIATTRAADLSAALTSSGFPYRYAFLPALSMRFVPVFQLEYSVVRDSQAVRGLRLERSLRGIIRSVRYTMTPMLFLAMSKVNNLASSMTGRGFGAHPTRTLLRPMRPSAKDAAVAAVGVLVACAVLILERALPLEGSLLP
ncbi:MAG: energy-coupling factor transporter transmembrane protein EcfT [Candidatus Thermoplasmatota archaeon]|nr:energy-coupling factor transporter transmembrane protein EcfT [Candidatus Thermoplasmatota archaeon]